MTFRTTYVTVSGLTKANSEPYRERMGKKGEKVVDEIIALVTKSRDPNAKPYTLQFHLLPHPPTEKKSGTDSCWDEEAKKQRPVKEGQFNLAAMRIKPERIALESLLPDGSEYGKGHSDATPLRKDSRRFLLGDTKYLKPINTSLVGALKCNEFADRLDLSLPTRLGPEGFPVQYLSNQSRMHPDLVEFVNKHIYDGKLKSAARTKTTLEQDLPGMPKALTKILRKFGNKKDIDEKALRVHYIVAQGPRRKDRAVRTP
jgi:hypothetical protein